MTTNRQPTPQPRTAGAMPRLLTLRDVTAATALSRSAVYAMMAESRFPKPIRIGSRAVRWVEQEVLDFIASRPRGGSEHAARVGQEAGDAPGDHGRGIGSQPERKLRREGLIRSSSRTP